MSRLQTRIRSRAQRVALLLTLLLGAAPLAAQEEWTPPIINFSPGTYTSQTATLAVQVSFSDQSALVSSSRWIKLNNVDVTANFSWEPSGSTLAYANDEVTLQLGSNTVEAYICDEWSNCNSNSVTYTYDPATYSVVVTPDDSAAFPRASATRDQKFTVKNTSTATATFNFTAVCTGSAISGSCTRSPTSQQLTAGDTITVTVTYTSGASVSSTGVVKLRAERSTDAAVKDSGTVTVTIGSHQTSGIDVSTVNPDSTVERDLCLTIAAGPGAAVECGDLRLVHSLPTVRTKNKARTPVLHYSSAQAHPFPLVAANVALPSGAAWPDSVVASLWLGATEKAHRRYTGDAWVPGRASRIVVGFDSLTIPTGVYSYKLKIVNW